MPSRETCQLRDVCNANGISCRNSGGKFLSDSILRRKLQFVEQKAGGKFMMKTFATQNRAITFVNDSANEIESIISMVTNHEGKIDVTYTISDSKYAAERTKEDKLKEAEFVSAAARKFNKSRHPVTYISASIGIMKGWKAQQVIAEKIRDKYRKLFQEERSPVEASVLKAKKNAEMKAVGALKSPFHYYVKTRDIDIGSIPSTNTHDLNGTFKDYGRTLANNEAIVIHYTKPVRAMDGKEDYLTHKCLIRKTGIFCMSSTKAVART